MVKEKRQRAVESGEAMFRSVNSIDLAMLQAHEQKAAIRTQCVYRKKKASKMSSRRRMEFHRRIVMMASEQASVDITILREIAKLRRQQEAELAQIKVQLMLKK